ncbi:fliM [Wigglesworthia glossinidia endosymbiont of Glossina brevipalpis]|uniref:Flagellar motor switch protein FliM n=1 Tax=Wigglesworthia glossinidia brevipalpis TaxID=36870 RepID=Q8D3E8_WIGBR|nr:fliM [Wigglesworthia glossinidia endosymbiont of Glossina brevipalpis]
MSNKNYDVEINNEKKNNFSEISKNIFLNKNKSKECNKSIIEKLNNVNQKFTGYIKKEITNYIKEPIDITSKEIYTQKYCDFIKDFNTLVSINLIKTNLFKNDLVIILTTEFVSIILDIFFGGTGNSFGRKNLNEFSISEKRIIDILNKLIINCYQKSLKDNINSINLELVTSDTCIQLINFDKNEKIFISKFNFHYKNLKINFFIIFSTFSVENENLFYEKKLSNNKEKEQNKWKNKLVNEIKSSKLLIQVKFADLSICVSDLINLNKGEIIPIVKTKKLTAYVDCIPVFSGSYGSLNGHYALRVENIINSYINKIDKG